MVIDEVVPGSQAAMLGLPSTQHLPDKQKPRITGIEGRVLTIEEMIALIQVNPRPQPFRLNIYVPPAPSSVLSSRRPSSRVPSPLVSMRERTVAALTGIFHTL